MQSNGLTVGPACHARQLPYEPIVGRETDLIKTALLLDITSSKWVGKIHGDGEHAVPVLETGIQTCYTVAEPSITTKACDIAVY